MRALAVLLALTVPALAAPPPGVNLDGELHAWFERQYSITGAWCCNIADGHILSDDQWRSSGRGYEVEVAGRWYSVPDNTLRSERGGPNPTGKAVVWYAKTEDGVRIWCFAVGPLY